MRKFSVVNVKCQQLSPFVDPYYSLFNRTQEWLNTKNINASFIIQTNYKQKCGIFYFSIETDLRHSWWSVRY